MALPSLDLVVVVVALPTLEAEGCLDAQLVGDYLEVVEGEEVDCSVRPQLPVKVVGLQVD